MKLTTFTPLRFESCAAGLLWLLIAPGLHAQLGIDPQQQRDSVEAAATVEALRDAALTGEAAAPGTSEVPTFAPSTTGDDDIGEQLILKRPPKEQNFTFTSDTFLFWTDNAANLPAGEIEDAFYGFGFDLEYRRRLFGSVFARAEFAQDFYRYADLTELNFESSDAIAGALAVIPKLANTVVYLDYYYNRLTQGEFESSVFDNHAIRLGAQKLFPINHANSFFLGSSAQLSAQTDPQELERHEYTVQSGYIAELTRNVGAQVSYRFSYFDYQNFDRDDQFHSFAASLIWTPREWLQFAAAATYTNNDSNLDFFDYQTWNVGATLSGTVQF